MLETLAAVRSHISDVVLCRNFAGYFALPHALRLIDGLCARVTPGGALFMDSFCPAKMPPLMSRIVELGGRPLRRHPVFLFREG